MKNLKTGAEEVLTTLAISKSLMGVFSLILFSIFVGIGAFGGAAIGLVIFAVSKGKSGYDKNILR